MTITLQARARQKIDELLTAAGWAVQHRDQLNLGAARGVEAQSEKYSVGLDAVPPAWHSPLPFLYEETRKKGSGGCNMLLMLGELGIFLYQYPRSLKNGASSPKSNGGSR